MIAAFIFFRIIKSCKSRTGAAEPGAGADFACTLPGLPVRAGIYCEAKIIQAAPTAKFIWRLWPCGLFSGEIGARTAYLRPVLSSSPAVLLRHALFPRHAESLPPPPCPFPSARRSSLAPSRPSDYLLPAPASFPAPAFSRTSVLFGLLSPVSTLLMADYPLLYLPCPGIPFLGIRPPRPRPSSSLLVPSCPFLSLLLPVSSPPLYSLFPAPAVPAVFSGGRRFWHENAKYFYIWEIIVNFLLLLAFNVK